MPTLLKNLKINTIGSVDYPANPNATVTLMKRDGSHGIGDGEEGDKKGKGSVLKSLFKDLSKIIKSILMTWEEDMCMNPDVLNSLPDDVKTYIQELEAKAALVDDLQQKVQELQAALNEQGRQGTDTGSQGVGKKLDSQDIFKSLPEEVKKYVQDIEKRAKEAEGIAKRERDARITKEFISKAAEFKALPIRPEEFGPVLKSVSEAVSPEIYQKVESVLEAANELVEKSKVFDEFGKGTGAGAGSSAWNKIESLASNLVQKNASMTKEQAIAQVLKQNPDLYTEYQKELLGE